MAFIVLSADGWRGRLRAMLAGLCWAAGAAAQSNPPPPELFFKPAEVLDAKLSPSGRRIAITSTLAGERVGLFVWELDTPAGDGGKPAPPRPYRAAQFSDLDIARFEWVNDDRLVFTLIDRSEGSAQQYAPGLFAVNHDGSSIRELVARREPALVSAPRMGRESLSWNHMLLAVPQGGGDEVIVGRQDVAGNELVGVFQLGKGDGMGHVERLRTNLGQGAASVTRLAPCTVGRGGQAAKAL